jgi:anti-anti-sigma factor
MAPAMEPPVTVAVERAGTDLIVYLSGELDAWTAEKVLDELAMAMWSNGNGGGDVIVDVTELWFIDGRGLAALADATAAARQRGGDLVIVGARPMLRRVGAVPRLGQLLTMRNAAVAE